MIGYTDARLWLVKCTLCFFVLTQGAFTVISGPNQVSAQALSRKTQHPTPDNIPEASSPELVLSETTSVTDGGHALVGKERERFILGVDEGEAHEMFGDIADISHDGHETLYIIDSGYKEVRAYNSHSGDFVGVFGRAGEGPGEFRSDFLKIAVEDRIISILDDTRIHIFERGEERSFVLSKTIKTPAWRASDLCIMDGYLYILAEYQEKPIHKMTLEGQVVASFGEPYKSSHPTVQTAMSVGGLLACNKRHGIVGWIRQHVPVLRGYTAQGEPLWITKFADFEPSGLVSGFRPDGIPTIIPELPEYGESMFVTLIADQADNFYVEYFTHPDVTQPDDIGNPSPLFRINARTGKGEYLGNGGVSAVSNTQVFRVRSFPFPQIAIYDRNTRAQN